MKNSYNRVLKMAIMIKIVTCNVKISWMNTFIIVGLMEFVLANFSVYLTGTEHTQLTMLQKKWGFFVMVMYLLHALMHGTIQFCTRN